MKDLDERERRRIAFGSYIRERRERLGYTQEEVAEALKVSRPTYVRYENGTRQIDLDRLIDLSDALRVSLDDFIIKYKASR